MLLQRGNFTINNISEIDTLETEKDGLKRIIDLDYMGKSEYEGNAIPLSRMIIEYNNDKYQFYNIDIFNNNGEQMIIYANSEQIIDILDWKEFALKLIERNYSMYEHVHNPKNEYGNNFWWNISGDYFIFFGEEKIESIKIYPSDYNKTESRYGYGLNSGKLSSWNDYEWEFNLGDNTIDDAVVPINESLIDNISNQKQLIKERKTKK